MAYRPAIKCGGKAFFVPVEAADGLKLCTAAQLRVLLLMLSGKCETPESAAAELGISIEDTTDLFEYWTTRGIFERDSAPAAAVKTAAPPEPAKKAPR